MVELEWVELGWQIYFDNRAESLPSYEFARDHLTECLIWTVLCLCFVYFCLRYEMLRNCQVTMIMHFVKRLMCEVEFFWEVLRKVRCCFLHGANCHISASNTQIADLERLNCQSALNQSAKSGFINRKYEPARTATTSLSMPA